MTDAEIATLAKMADVCLAKGIRLLEVGGCRMEFGPKEAPLPAERQGQAELDMCRCGHAEHQHMNGLCVLGCGPDRCAGPEAKE